MLMSILWIEVFADEYTMDRARRKKLSRLGMVSERGNGAVSVGTPCNSVTHLMDSSWTST